MQKKEKNKKKGWASLVTQSERLGTRPAHGCLICACLTTKESFLKIYFLNYNIIQTHYFIPINIPLLCSVKGLGVILHHILSMPPPISSLAKPVGFFLCVCVSDSSPLFVVKDVTFKLLVSFLMPGLLQLLCCWHLLTHSTPFSYVQNAAADLALNVHKTDQITSLFPSLH